MGPQKMMGYIAWLENIGFIQIFTIYYRIHRVRNIACVDPDFAFRHLYRMA